MHLNFNFRDALAASARAGSQIEDVLPEGANLDCGRRFLPASLARIGAAAFLGEAQQHQALRRTCLGSGMIPPRFPASPAAISPAVRDRVAAAAPAL